MSQHPAKGFQERSLFKTTNKSKKSNNSRLTFPAFNVILYLFKIFFYICQKI